MSKDPDFAKAECQDARSKLRETFLQRIMALQGKPCNITTYEKNNVEGEFQGFDIHFQKLLFNNLKTPAGCIPHTIMRAGDIISVEFSDDMETT